VTELEEVARRAWDAFNRKDFETVLDTLHPDVEWRPAQGPGGMEGQVYRGRDAYRDWLYRDLPEVWEDFHAEEVEIVDAGDDRVVVSGYVVGIGRGSGAEIRVPFSQLGWFHDDKAIRIDGFLSREGAREAAGLR
jgi:ketosteroid isomerase-like protein